MTISRRGFLGAMLAAAAAPAIVRADSLMRIVVPKQEIILPTLNILVGDTSGLGAGAYTASVWVKAAGGQWERIAKTFDVAPCERRNITIDLPHENALVYGLQLESPSFAPLAEVSIAVSNGGSIRFDAQQTPYTPGERIGMSRHTVER
jgi:hypothetical protein